MGRWYTPRAPSEYSALAHDPTREQHHARTSPTMAKKSSFPDSTDTVTLSQRGGVTVGSGARRYYQTYYRNSAAAFCPPETFNVTNGWVVDW